MAEGESSAYKVVLSAEKIEQRVQEMARHISEDYRGRTVYAVGVLDNGFVFMADLVRNLTVNVLCQFVKPQPRELLEEPIDTTEILYSPELDVAGQHVLLVEAILDTGITTDFLCRNFLTRGAASVKVATLLDRHFQRRISLRPDYFGFVVDDSYLAGYGLGTPDLNRNLPDIVESRWVPAAYLARHVPLRRG